ncbi:MAG: hypothetical protein SGI77_14330 [Pirellulaceae bacterium]|nr:hypothetical protein [Pirellulaceae bacterium]
MGESSEREVRLWLAVGLGSESKGFSDVASGTSCSSLPQKLDGFLGRRAGSLRGASLRGASLRSGSLRAGSLRGVSRDDGSRFSRLGGASSERLRSDFLPKPANKSSSAGAVSREGAAGTGGSTGAGSAPVTTPKSLATVSHDDRILDGCSVLAALAWGVGWTCDGIESAAASEVSLV